MPQPDPRSSPLAEFLEGAFQDWEAHEVRYLVLRNYDGLPTRVGNDVDILVEPALLGRAEALLIASARRAGYRLHNRGEFGPTCLYFSRGREQVQIDLFGALRWRGLRLVDADRVLAGRRRCKTFFVPDASDEATLNLLTGLLYSGKIKTRYREGILAQLATRQAVPDPLRDAFGARAADALRALIVREQWDAIEASAPVFRRRLITRRLAFEPIQALSGLASDVRRLWKRFGSPPGLAVILIGPDGCGKSTVAESLVKDLAGTFSPDKGRYVHWKPRVLPIRRTNDGVPVVDPHGQPPRGVLASAAYFTAHVFEFVVGAWTQIRPTRFRGGLVVADRYFLDFYVDPARYRLRLPIWMIRAGGRLVGVPGPVFYLDVPGAMLARRKGELGPDETERQRAAFERLVARVPQAQMIDGSPAPSHVASAIVDRVLDHLTERAAARAEPRTGR